MVLKNEDFIVEFILFEEYCHYVMLKGVDMICILCQKEK